MRSGSKKALLTLSAHVHNYIHGNTPSQRMCIIIYMEILPLSTCAYNIYVWKYSLSVHVHIIYMYGNTPSQCMCI